jgi:pyroglutamyl-peptidase
LGKAPCYSQRQCARFDDQSQGFSTIIFEATVRNSRKSSKTLLFRENVTLAQMPNTMKTASKAPLKTLLLTGFEAFGDDPSGQGLNPSEHIAQALHGQRLGKWQVHSITLPCEYTGSVSVLKKALRGHQPHAVVCLGQAGGRSAISLERIAVNWDEAGLADNTGVLRSGQPILKTAPVAYFSTLPIQRLRNALLAQNIPAELSSTAGHFVCNHVFFQLMHSIKLKQQNKRPAGFVHVPYLPEQASGGQPSMALQDMVHGVSCLIKSL